MEISTVGDLLELIALYRKFRDAIESRDWRTVIDLVGDVIKLAATLVDEKERTKMLSMMAAVDTSGLTEEEKAKLDPATIALIVQLVALGLDLLVKWIKKRRGL